MKKKTVKGLPSLAAYGDTPQEQARRIVATWLQLADQIRWLNTSDPALARKIETEMKVRAGFIKKPKDAQPDG